MKNIFSSKHLWAIILLSTLGSCKKLDEKFLTATPETFYTVDNVFSTSAQVDQAVISIYSQLRDVWTNPTSSAAFFVFRGNGTDMFDVASIRRANSFNNYGNINPLNSTFNSIFSTWYQIIAKANLAIYSGNLPNINWGSAADKANTLGQARFFRAFAYKNLAELFGGVPLVTEITRVARYDYTRATRVETYQYAIDDLLAIENDLPETTPVGGRIVRGAAQHNLSELYLAMGTQLAADGKSAEAQAAFTKSITFASKVIDGGTYSLMQSRFGARRTEPQGNVYWDLFQENNVNYQNGNRECIWPIQIDYAAYRAEDNRSKLPYPRNYGNIIRAVTPTYVGGLLEDVGGRGISQVMPTMYTRDIIYTGVYGNDMRNTDIVFKRIFIGNIPGTIYFGLPVPYSVLYSTKDNQSLAYPISCKISTDKFTGLADGEDRSNLFRDDYFIRLPETILLRAEAKQRMGDNAGAAADVNLLRTRAQCGYMVTPADMEDKFTTILEERTRELVYEECRWNTLLRMGGTIAVDRIKKYAFWPEAQITLNSNFNLWPIPQQVIDANKDVKLAQNPGW